MSDERITLLVAGAFFIGLSFGLAIANVLWKIALKQSIRSIETDESASKYLRAVAEKIREEVGF